MKKYLFGIMAVFAMIILPGQVMASGTCNTRYPVILAHGMGASAEILGIVDYWWGIEKELEANGADVYITSVNGMDSTVAKAKAFKAQALKFWLHRGKIKSISSVTHTEPSTPGKRSPIRGWPKQNPLPKKKKCFGPFARFFSHRR